MGQKSKIQNVSDTALWVAYYRDLESKRPDAVFKDPLAAVLMGDRGKEIAESMPYPEVLEWIMVTRTIAIDRLIEEALAAGIDTVINLGAGLDTRPYRMDLPPTLRWIEVDFPHMIELKSKKLASYQPKCALQRVALDLSDREASRAFFAAEGARTRKVLVITEGVIAYLSVEHAGNLADDLREVASFQFWIQDYRNDNASNHPRRIEKRMRHSPFRFTSPDALAFFAQHGWRERHKILALAEGQRINRNLRLSPLRRLAVALLPKSKKEQFFNSYGYALLEKDVT